MRFTSDDYKEALRQASTDLVTIAALLGFSGQYPGVDALLRKITDLMAAAPATQPADALDADTFWETDDPDTPHDTLHDAVVAAFEGGGVRPGGYVEIGCSASRPNILVRIISDRPFHFVVEQDAAMAAPQAAPEHPTEGVPAQDQPVAYLHDDGYWTPAKSEAGRAINERLMHAGSPKIGVFTAAQGTGVPAPAADALNLQCKSVQKRLAEQWGFVPAADALDAKDRECLAIGRAVNRAALELPADGDIRIEIENGAGVVYVYEPKHGDWRYIDSGEVFSAQINEAIDSAIATQAKGGSV